ncbi:MAG: hemerythrin domain-containing protein [Thermodesulfobacteriota bacterium]
MRSERYIAELQGGHKRIEEIFTVLRKVIEEEHEPDIGAAMRALGELKDILVSHVKDEDEHFYPALRQRAVELGQEALLPAIDLFSDSMHGISEKVGAFFGRYEKEGDVQKDIEGFKVKLAEIIEIVEERMKSEEGSLFYIYKAYFPEEE